MDETDKLIMLKNRGETNKYIAAELHRSKSAVDRRIYEIRRDRPAAIRYTRSEAWSENDKMQLTEMYKNGVPTWAIAEKLERSRPAVYNMVSVLKRRNDDV